MPNALAVVAHHDDHVLWMGGSILRLKSIGWNLTVIAMCIDDHQRKQYFDTCCKQMGVDRYQSFPFRDYLSGAAFSLNNRQHMESCLSDAIGNENYDLIFTHSRFPLGEYWALHANHVEVREITRARFNASKEKIAYFDYDVIYGGGTGTCARTSTPNWVIQLTYRELVEKAFYCIQAPDANTSLVNLAYPCPNPEAFEGDNLILPTAPFIARP